MTEPEIMSRHGVLLTRKHISQLLHGAVLTESKQNLYGVIDHFINPYALIFLGSNTIDHSRE